MSSWFDRLLEELQRRQEEADAAREGRPLPPRAARGSRTNGGSGDEPPRDVREELARRRARGGGGGRGGAPFGGPTSGWDAGRIRRWVLIGIAVVAILFLFGFAGGLVDLLTDLMWYEALGRRDILTTRLTAQIGLFFVGFAAFVIPAVISILVARRVAPQVPLRRIGQFELPDISGVSRWITIAIIGLAVLLGLGSGAAWAGSWETILLAANGGDFGTVDPHFARDVGFYVFDLPFYRFLQGFAITTLIAVIVFTLGTYAAGALTWQFRLTAPVRAHLSVLGALVLGAIAIGFQFDIAELSYSTNGYEAMQAVSYTDLHAQVPAFSILTVLAVVAALLMLANIWFRTLWLLGLTAAAWVAASILIGSVYPGFVQTFQVNPNEQNAERPFIAAHIGATREAFDLDVIEERRFTGAQDLTREVFTEDAATIDNLRLWDYRPLLTTFGQDQILRRYYNFLDVDIDRYDIGGEQRQIMLSARELDVERLADQARTWTNERLVFTHGYGITAVPVDGVTPQGTPDYLVSGINREPQLPLDQPRIYFGEATDTYVVTQTGTDEFDYPLDEATDAGASTTWQGSTGVGIGNFFTRALFALHFGDFNLLISDQLTDDSQILFRRTLEERAPEIAPFLHFDRDPYIVSADEELLWVWDAYTVSSRYPDAQPLPADSPFPGANYVRNSVKVVVDAYDGTVHFYLADQADPIAAAYGRIFPTLFEPLDAMPEALRAHLRYPEDLFTAQNTSYLLYHLPATDGGATAFYNQEDRWAIPEDVSQAGQPMEPYYVIMRIPGEDEAEFALIQPLVPERRANMIAWVAARMDPGVYGERITFQFPTGTTTQGPAQVEARIDQDATVAAQFGVWSRSGSSIIRGNLLVLPIGDDGLLYVEPIFLQAEGAPFPEFVRVIMVSEDRVAFAEDVEDGLRQLLGEAQPPPVEEPEPPPDPGEPGESPGPLPGDAAGLVAEAQRLYEEAQEALADGDLGTYQERIDELEAVLEALADLTGASPAPSP
ncbi:MAG TPA: UPF0182 family protein [Candidatus Limnocylindria bacterium]|nr:UPF0182 family protein [Candidatus Limnocylindria bacterium]